MSAAFPFWVPSAVGESGKGEIPLLLVIALGTDIAFGPNGSGSERVKTEGGFNERRPLGASVGICGFTESSLTRTVEETDWEGGLLEYLGK